MRYRAEIDGLRAFAVLSVVLYHGFPNFLTGGFMGVDVFFVISGYLITSIIFKELDKDTFSFANFLGRRVKRLYPALILVMLSALIFGLFALLADEYTQLGKHIASGAAFVLNFVLAGEFGYFDNAAETKPMLHLWSLAVEEQFYIIWPLVLWFAWKRKFNLLTLTVTVAVTSFVWNLSFVNRYPSETFFWPFGRFWELLSGSVLGWFVLYKGELLNKTNHLLDCHPGKIIRLYKMLLDGLIVANLMSLLGFFILIYGVIAFNNSLSFPGMRALIPVSGTLLVIAAGSDAWLNRFIFMNPIAIWFGLISYPLYLWHWPILSFLRIIEGETPHQYAQFIAIVISIFLAWLTFQFVEKPIRNNKRSTRLKLILLIILSAMIGITGLLISQAKIRNQEQEPSLISFKETASNCSLLFPDWNTENDNRCRFQKTDNNTIAIIGDSHAGHLFDGLAEGLLSTNQSVVLFPASCQPPLMSVSSAFNIENNSRLRIMRENGYKYILKGYDHILNSGSIHTVIMAHVPWCDNSIKDMLAPLNTNYAEIIKSGFVRTLRALVSNGKNVIVILDNPILDVDPTSCLQRWIGPFANEKCVRKESFHRENLFIKVYNRVALSVIEKFNADLEVTKKHGRVSVLDLADVLCTDGLCRAISAGKLLYMDRNHLSLDGSRYVAPFIIDHIDLN